MKDWKSFRYMIEQEGHQWVVVDRNTHERSDPMEIYQAYRAAAEMNMLPALKSENANALNAQS